MNRYQDETYDKIRDYFLTSMKFAGKREEVFLNLFEYYYFNMNIHRKLTLPVVVKLLSSIKVSDNTEDRIKQELDFRIEYIKSRVERYKDSYYVIDIEAEVLTQVSNDILSSLK